jgi:hypothetical protein
MKVYMMGLGCSRAFVRNAGIVFISSVYDQEGSIICFQVGGLRLITTALTL